MSERNSPSDDGTIDAQSHANHPGTPSYKAYRLATDGGVSLADLRERVQVTQDRAEKLENKLPAHARGAHKLVEDGLEVIEDDLEDSDDVPDDMDARVQEVQNDVGDLQRELAGADNETRQRAENLEDALEDLEDAVADQRIGYGVKVGNDPVQFFDDPRPTAKAILERFGEKSDDALVERGTENTYSGDNKVDLSGPGIERFTSEPQTGGNS
jgi:archaellum component FlaC